MLKTTRNEELGKKTNVIPTNPIGNSKMNENLSQGSIMKIYIL